MEEDINDIVDRAIESNERLTQEIAELQRMMEQLEIE